MRHKEFHDLTPPPENEVAKEIRLLRQSIEDMSMVIAGLCDQLSGKVSNG